MSKRRLQWVAVAAFAMTAGCLSSLSPNDPPSPPDEDPVPLVAGFTLQDCSMPVVLAAMPTELDQLGMPPGFTLVPDDPATHTVEYRGLTCDRLDGRQASTGLMDATTRVVPPPEYMDPAITDYVISDGGYVQGEILAPLSIWANETNETFLFSEATITSTQTTLGVAATGSVVSKATNGLIMTLNWSAAGQSQEVGRTYRLFLMGGNDTPRELVGAIDVTVSNSSVLTAGAGYMHASLGTSFVAYPGKGARVHHGFSVQMSPVQLAGTP